MIVDEFSAGLASLVAIAESTKRRGDLQPVVFIFSCSDYSVFNVLRRCNFPTARICLFVPFEPAQNLDAVFIVNLQPRLIRQLGGSTALASKRSGSAYPGSTAIASRWISPLPSSSADAAISIARSSV